MSAGVVDSIYHRFLRSNSPIKIAERFSSPSFRGSEVASGSFGRSMVIVVDYGCTKCKGIETPAKSRVALLFAKHTGSVKSRVSVPSIRESDLEKMSRVHLVPPTFKFASKRLHKLKVCLKLIRVYEIAFYNLRLLFRSNFFPSSLRSFKLAIRQRLDTGNISCDIFPPPLLKFLLHLPVEKNATTCVLFGTHCIPSGALLHPDRAMCHNAKPPSN